jgi:hypothetical protein
MLRNRIFDTKFIQRLKDGTGLNVIKIEGNMS